MMFYLLFPSFSS